jgi:hypothetical protein
MYLALLPDADSLAALKRFAPSLPADAHVTIIHSNSYPLPPAIPNWSGALMLETDAVDMFGRNKHGLKFKLNENLYRIRSEAEGILHAVGLSWSKQWAYVPHITLGPLRAKMPPPTTLRFDRMEWR